MALKGVVAGLARVQEPYRAASRSLATPATTQLYRKLIDFTRKGRFTAVELPSRFPFEIESIQYRLVHSDNESHAKSKSLPLRESILIVLPFGVAYSRRSPIVVHPGTAVSVETPTLGRLPLVVSPRRIIH